MTSDYKKSREEAFKRLAEKRVTKAIRALDSVMKLSDKRNYSYNPDQANQLIQALETKLNHVIKEFNCDQKEEDENFKFK